jgi:hypothetical protein
VKPGLKSLRVPKLALRLHNSRVPFKSYGKASCLMHCPCSWEKPHSNLPSRSLRSLTEALTDESQKVNCERTVGNRSAVFIAHWCPWATNPIPPWLVAQDTYRSSTNGKGCCPLRTVVQKKDINTINPKGNYTQSERVQPIHIYIYINNYV